MLAANTRTLPKHLKQRITAISASTALQSKYWAKKKSDIRVMQVMPIEKNYIMLIRLTGSPHFLL
jgi:hypothetical protein